MTEGRIKYAEDVEREFTISLFDSDLAEVDEYINKNKEAIGLPEAVYAVLSSVVSASLYRKDRRCNTLVAGKGGEYDE